MTRYTWVAIALATSILAGCATRPAIPASVAGGETMRIEDDLVGAFIGEGEFKPRFSGETRGLTARMVGTWDEAGQTLTLVEDFLYDDGETDRKTWVLTRTGPGEWEGTREDVVGKARGFEDGDAFRLEYNVRLGGRTVGFRDVLVERADGTVFNRATVGYYGLQVGTVELVIREE